MKSKELYDTLCEKYPLAEYSIIKKMNHSQRDIAIREIPEMASFFSALKFEEAESKRQRAHYLNSKNK